MYSASPFARDQAIAVTIEEAELPRTFRFDKDSQAVLAFAIEQMLTVYFHRGQLCAQHAKRKSLRCEDVQLGETLSNEELVLKSLQDQQHKQMQEAKAAELVARTKRRRLVCTSSAPKTPAAHAPSTPPCSVLEEKANEPADGFEAKAT